MCFVNLLLHKFVAYTCELLVCVVLCHIRIICPNPYFKITILRVTMPNKKTKKEKIYLRILK